MKALMALADVAKGGARAMLPAGAIARLRPWFHYVRDRRILLEPDRRYLHDSIVPSLARAGVRSVLFVGTRSYSQKVVDALSRAGLEIWTNDIDPEAEKFGVPGRHITTDIRHMQPDALPIRPDAVILNGVLGYGVDNAEGCAQTLGTLATLLESSGLLVIGWNVDRSPDPTDMALVSGFEAYPLVGGQTSVKFANSFHRYDFFRRK